MNRTTANKEQTKHDGAQAGSVAVVVVVGALPEREAVGEEVVVAVSRRSLEDVGNERQASLLLGRLLDGSLDFGRRGSLGGLRAGLVALLPLALCFVCAKLLRHLVGMQRSCPLAVGLADVILRGRVGDTEDVVKGRGRVGLVGGNLIADAKDFAI